MQSPRSKRYQSLQVFLVHDLHIQINQNQIDNLLYTPGFYLDGLDHVACQGLSQRGRQDADRARREA